MFKCSNSNITNNTIFRIEQYPYNEVKNDKKLNYKWYTDNRSPPPRDFAGGRTFVPSYNCYPRHSFPYCNLFNLLFDVICSQAE